MKKIDDEKKAGKILMLVVGAILAIAASVFLFTKDDGLTGWQVLKNQSGEAWFWMIFFSALTGGAVFYFIKKYKTDQQLNSWIVFAVLATFFSIAFGKACTDKANSKVPTEQVDDGRVPAQDLIPK